MQTEDGRWIPDHGWEGASAVSSADRVLWSYDEIAPVPGSFGDRRDQAMTITAFGERRAA